MARLRLIAATCPVVVVAVVVAVVVVVVVEAVVCGNARCMCATTCEIVHTQLLDYDRECDSVWITMRL